MGPYELAVILLLIATHIVREFFLHRERQAVYDRLMARSLPEFKDNETIEPNLIDEAADDEDSVPLEEARDELTGEAYGKN